MNIYNRRLYAKVILILLIGSPAFGMGNVAADLLQTAIHVGFGNLSRAASAAWESRMNNQLDNAIKSVGLVKEEDPKKKDTEKTPKERSGRMQQQHQSWTRSQVIRDQQARRAVISLDTLKTQHARAMQLSDSWHTLAKIALAHGSERRKSLAQCHKILDKFKVHLDTPTRLSCIGKLASGVDKLDRILVKDSESKEHLKGPFQKGKIPKHGDNMNWKDKDPDRQKMDRYYKKTTHSEKRQNERHVTTEQMKEAVENPDYCRYGYKENTLELIKQISNEEFVTVIWGFDPTMGEPAAVTAFKIAANIMLRRIGK